MTPYTLTYSFTGYQAINPGKPLPAPEIDVQFSNLQESITTVIAAVDQVRRSDGTIQNGVVTFDSLDAQLAAIIGGTHDITAQDLDPSAFATQSQAEGGAANDKIMTPLRSAQALDSRRPFASQSQAQSAVDVSDSVMSPRRVRESIDARRPYASQAQAEGGIDPTNVMTPQRTTQALDALRTAHSAVANLTIASIAAGASATQTVSVAGAQVGDGVIVGLPAAGLAAGLVPVAWVSAEGAVTLRITNTTAAAVTPPEADYRLTAIRF